MADRPVADPTPAPGTVAPKGLAPGKLGLLGSTVIGVASTAPLFSLAATLGLVVIAVGAQAPIAFVLAFIPMLFTAIAYRELNKDMPDCGTVFTWATKAFGPRTGWMAGWSIAMAGVLVMANLAEISAIYLLDLVGDGSLAHNRTVVTALGCAVIAAMTWISLRGVQIGERMQQALLAVQYLALVGFVVGCVIGYSTGTAPHPTAPSLTWFNPLAADGTALGKAILLALFIYWGWDACLALTEETKDPRRTPGRAATLSTVILLITYVGVTVVAIMYAGLGNSGVGLANQDNAEDVFSGLAGEALGPVGWFLVIAVAVSALSSSQTTILPTARGTFAMGIYRALPARFATVDDTTRTPTFSTILVGVVSILYYAGMNLVSTSMLADSILSIGLAIAFFYGIAGYACIWYFRRNLFDSRRHALYRFVLPLLGATFMTWAFIRSAIDMADPGYGSTSLAGVGSTFLIGIGSLLLGVALMLLWARFPAARDFFEKRSLHRDTEILAPD